MREKECRTATQQLVQNNLKYEKYIEAVCKQRMEINTLQTEAAMDRIMTSPAGSNPYHIGSVT